MSSTLIAFNDPQLFGNDAADLEREDLLRSYFVSRPQYEAFCLGTNSILIAHGFKGEGKSALLKYCQSQLQERGDHSLVICKSGTDLKPEGQGDDPDDWVRAWKRQLFQVIACEFGATFSVALTDDAMALVELAEQEGFRPRNWFRSVLDRIAPKLKAEFGVATTALEVSRITPANHGELLQRWKDRSPEIWLFIDDVDQNFENTRIAQLKVATFLTAVREVAAALPELRVRTAIRPNVWTVVATRFAALSHVKQYLFPITWDMSSLRTLLSERIRAYCERKQLQELLQQPRIGGENRDEAIVRIAFESPVTWNGRLEPVHIALGSLALMRPRWIVQLCRSGGKLATERKHQQIQYKDILDVMRGHGHECLTDMIAEFSSQCDVLGELITSFKQCDVAYTTSDLLKHIDNRILQHLRVEISGADVSHSSTRIAHFLFQIGFVVACKDTDTGGVEYQSFVDNPSLLASKVNVDQGYRWEIHAVFRQALDLQGKANERARNSRKKKSK